MPFDGTKTTERLDILMELVSKNQDVRQLSFCDCLWHECIEHPRLAELGLADYGEMTPYRFAGCPTELTNIPFNAARIGGFFLAGTPFTENYSRFGYTMFGARSKEAKHQYLKTLMEGDHAI